MAGLMSPCSSFPYTQDEGTRYGHTRVILVIPRQQTDATRHGIALYLGRRFSVCPC